MDDQALRKRVREAPAFQPGIDERHIGDAPAAAAGSPQPLQAGLRAVAETGFGEIWSRIRRLGEGEAAVGSAEPDLIHDLRIHLRRFCALSELLPWHEGDRAAARTLRKEVAWAMQPLSLARDWDVFLRETLPRLCEAEPDLDREAAVARALARSALVHGEMYAGMHGERFQGVVRLLKARMEDMRQAVAQPPPPALYGKLRRVLKKWEAGIRQALARGPKQDARSQHRLRIEVKRLRYAGEAVLALGPSRRLERHVKALTALQGALGGMQDLRTASWLGQEVCISLSTGKLARRSSAKASQRLLREADRDWRAARRRFMRQPAFWAAADHGKLARRLSGLAPG
jgi:CHAD domain-containing protein